MATPDTLRHRRIPLAHGTGAIPAVGFGTLIPDPVATKQATSIALDAGFRHLDCAERYRNEAAVADACRKRSRRDGFGGRIFSSPPNYGTPIIVLSGSSPPSTLVGGGCSSTMSTAISSIPLLPFDPATIKTQGTSAVRSSTIEG
jgi:hypothetical protein